MKVSELMQHWQSTSTGTVTRDAYTIKLPVDAAARVAALAELYPGHNVEQLITDLLSAALEELETSLPYVRGEQVVGTDEQGDPPADPHAVVLMPAIMPSLQAGSLKARARSRRWTRRALGAS